MAKCPNSAEERHDHATDGKFHSTLLSAIQSASPVAKEKKRKENIRKLMKELRLCVGTVFGGIITFTNKLIKRRVLNTVDGAPSTLKNVVHI